jgi:diguanylate cyclase
MRRLRQCHLRSCLAKVFVALVLLVTNISVYAEEPLALDVRAGTVQLWPRTTLLFETDKVLSVNDARDAVAQFERPKNDYSTLGVRQQAVWLRVPFFTGGADTASSPELSWIFEIEYPPLQKVDVYLFDSTGLRQTSNLGSLRPFENRPLAGRTHAVPLLLKPAQHYELLVRIETKGAIILPITLEAAGEFHQGALGEQILQGLLLGISLCLLLYSLFQGVFLRELFFLKYALLVTGSTGTSLLQMGIGAQYLWTNSFWIEQHVAGLASLAAICGTFLFLEEALREPLAGEDKPFIYPLFMKGGAIFSVVLAVAFALDVFDLRVLSAVMMVLSVLPTLVSVPKFIQRVRRNDAVGYYLIFAWTVYMIGAGLLAALIRGHLPVTFWTLHSFQFAATFDMLAFMYVLSARTREVRLAAYRASKERDAMRSLANTDPLTGLANRRGLNEALAATLVRSTEGDLVAVYVIDVDGFKPVNDRYGHDMGDKLLIAIGQRLTDNMRKRDVVARVGGDEFILVASGLRQIQQAHDLGTNLLAVFNESIEVTPEKIHIGLTIGYAIVPFDAQDASAAIKLADAAMYEGKQSGKRCLKRATNPVMIEGEEKLKELVNK